MAKPRKQKNGEQQQQQNKSESSGSIVRHQKLCLSIDMERQMIYGHTEMKIVFPESGFVNLHADNMIIGSVSIDGEPAEFELMPHYQLVEDEKRWSSVSCSTTAADAACSAYLSSLSREMAPNLLISCHKTMKPVNDQGGQADAGCPSQKPSEESKQLPNGYDNHAEHQNVKLVRIDYSVQRSEVGIHFGDNVLCTDNQLRRAHCWFPCLDSILQRCCYDLEFTVGSNFVAVSNGSLLYQVLSKDDPPRKTYVYNMSVPVSAGWISLTVAPFEIFPDCHNGLLTHMCLPPNFSKLQNTVGFFHSAFSHYEDYLSTSFPFGSYKQVFVHPEISISSMSLGASMCIFSSQLLFDEKVIDETIDTRIKLAYALARQWFGVFVVAETPNDEWLLEGLAGFLSDLFIKRFLGNNEARYRRYKANCAVCKVDVSGATALSTSAASNDLYGTQCIGLYGKIRSWKAVAILQMLEKQMGPESFRKILHIIIYRARDTNRSLRTLSSKEFRHLANKVGNLERPFLKEFFPRWVGSCGCPILRMGFSYNKRRNMIELAAIRGCTAPNGSIYMSNPDTECQEGDPGWPGMMSIRVHELDGMYDHPSLPMAGESWQLLEIQCHSRLAAKRYQKPKKGTKHDGSDDNGDTVPTPDTRTCMDSPLSWLRVDPEMEYLAEIHFYQPVQMWINQLEKDKDVVAQSQAISTLRELPHISFSIVNTLNNFLNDSKAFWRVRIEAAFALAHTASEDTDWAGLLHLVKFYKSRRFDADIGLPRPNDFQDVPEYFVLEAIPHAIALIRAADKKSPREAVEFVLQLLKYNDNSGNPYSDVYWLAALVQSVGELEFGHQNIIFLSSLLKRIDRLLQFDSLMPSYNGILTISCIRTLTQIAVKMSSSVPLDRVFQLIKSFHNSKRSPWKVRVEASRALLNLEYHLRGLDAAMSLFVDFLENEQSLRGQVKLAVHAMHLCQTNGESESTNLKCPTLAALLCLLASRKAFNNIFLRHHLFCILQIVAGRPPTLFGFPRVQPQPTVDTETCSDEKRKPSLLKLKISGSQEPFVADTANIITSDPLPVAEAAKDAADTVSNGNERRVPLVKIKVKQAAASSKMDGINEFHGINNEMEFGPTSSVSVDAPPRGEGNDPPSVSNQNLEEVNSSHDHESRVTASIGSAKIAINEVGKEFQCTADSRGDILETDAQNSSLQCQIVERRDPEKLSLVTDGQTSKGKEKKEKKKNKKRKREDKLNEKDHHDDPEYLKKKRRKKEKKRIERELAKVQSGEPKSSAAEMHRPLETKAQSPSVEMAANLKGSVMMPRASKNIEMKGDGLDGGMGPKVRIKIKSRSIGNL